tara:strand:+ start:81 stop:479 length:399 start_codon:yes stop_codon:yes gene_type:complete
MWQITALLGVALTVSVGGFKLYYDKSEAEKETMAIQLRQAADNQAILESSIAKQNKELLDQEARTQAVLNRINVLSDENRQAQQEVESIRQKFAKHNMDVLSLRKPKLIEKIINKGTKGVLNDLEIITNPTP